MLDKYGCFISYPLHCQGSTKDAYVLFGLCTIIDHAFQVNILCAYIVNKCVDLKSLEVPLTLLHQ